MAWNQGMNFGLFDFGAAGRWVLVAVALAIVVGLMLWVRRGGWLQAIGAGAIIGGAPRATSGTGCSTARWRISST